MKDLEKLSKNELIAELREFREMQQSMVENAIIKRTTEIKLKESEERFHQMFENHNAAMLLIEPETGKIIDANLSAQNLYGYSEETIKKLAIQDINSIPEEELLDLRKQALNKSQNYFVFSHSLANAEIRTVEVYSSPIIINKKQILFSIIHDITEQKQAEEELIKQKNLFELVINSVPARIFWKDLNSVYLGCNTSFLKAVEKNKIENVIGKTDFDLFCAQEAEKHINDDIELIKNGIPKLRYEESYTLANGQKIWWQSSKIALKNNAGEIVGILATSEDITERKQTEEKLKESEEKFRALYDNAPLSYQSLNEDGSFKDVNPTWLSTLGYERNEVIGKFYKDFLHPDWQAHFEDNFPAFKKRGYVNDVQFKIRHKNGHYIDIAFEGCIGYHPDGSFKQTYCVFTDITERKQAEEALLVNQKRYKEAQAIGQVGNWEYDPKTTKFWASDESRKIFGYDLELEEFTTENIENCIPEREQVHQALIDLIEHDKKYDLVYDIISKDKGIRKTVHSMAKIERDALGNPSKISGVVSDISKQKKAEEKLRDSEYLYKETQRLSKMGGWSYDVESGQSSFTDTIYEIYGKTFSTAEEGMQFYHPDDIEMVSNSFKEALTKQKPYDLEVRLINAQGDNLFIRTIGQPVIKNGKVIKIYGNLIDITERKLAEQELTKHRENLENLVNERTKELQTKNIELERFNDLFVDREFRIKELKNEIKKLKS